MAFRIQLRNDTSANWLEVDPVLLQGEPAYENDTNRLKIGNGASGYAQLPYFYGAVSGINGLTGAIGITGGTGIQVQTGQSISISLTRPYKIYTCNLNSSGTDDPSQLVLESEFESSIVWTRGSTGVYYAGLTGATGATAEFGPASNKLMIQASSSQIGSILYGSYVDSDTLQITQIGITGPYLDGLDNCFVEIRVY